MLEAIILTGVLAGFFILRGIAATVFFYSDPAHDRGANAEGHELRGRR